MLATVREAAPRSRISVWSRASAARLRRWRGLDGRAIERGPAGLAVTGRPAARWPACRWPACRWLARRPAGRCGWPPAARLRAGAGGASPGGPWPAVRLAAAVSRPPGCRRCHGRAAWSRRPGHADRRRRPPCRRLGCGRRRRQARAGSRRRSSTRPGRRSLGRPGSAGRARRPATRSARNRCLASARYPAGARPAVGVLVVGWRLAGRGRVLASILAGVLAGSWPTMQRHSRAHARTRQTRPTSPLPELD